MEALLEKYKEFFRRRLIKDGRNSQLNSILLEGEIGAGKTSIAAWAAV